MLHFHISRHVIVVVEFSGIVARPAVQAHHGEVHPLLRESIPEKAGTLTLRHTAEQVAACVRKRNAYALILVRVDIRIEIKIPDFRIAVCCERRGLDLMQRLAGSGLKHFETDAAVFRHIYGIS